jgi:lysophospholipase L1-like esterase
MKPLGHPPSGVRRTIFRLAVLLVILGAALGVAFFGGAAAYRAAVFPFGQGFLAVFDRFIGVVDIDPRLEERDLFIERYCLGHRRKFGFYAEAGENGFVAEMLFVGDSLVDGFFDSRLLSTPYLRVGSSGNVIECLPLLVSSILAMNPRKVLIYMGGNDADLQGRQLPAQAAATYGRFVDELVRNGVEVAVHGVHGGRRNRLVGVEREGALTVRTVRDREYVAELNERLQQLAQSRGLLYISPVEEFAFPIGDKGEGPYTYDGEHLTFLGYQIWFSHIRKYLSDF